MNAKEALKELEELDVMSGGVVEACKAALREKVAREEFEKPKRPSLEEQEERVRNVAGCKGQNAYIGEPAWHELIAAADTLKVVRTRLVPWLRRFRNDYRTLSGFEPLDGRMFLKELGEQP